MGNPWSITASARTVPNFNIISNRSNKELNVMLGIKALNKTLFRNRQVVIIGPSLILVDCRCVLSE